MQSVSKVYDIAIMISDVGANNWIKIKGLTNMVVNPERETYEYVPADEKGWKSRFVIGGALTLEVEGEINYDDEGQNKVRSLATKLGEDAMVDVKVIEVNYGYTVSFTSIVDVSKLMGGATTELSTFSASFMSSGKVTSIEGVTDNMLVTKAKNVLLATTFEIPESKITDAAGVKTFIKTEMVKAIKAVSSETITIDDTNAVGADAIVTNKGVVGFIGAYNTITLTLNAATITDAATKIKVIANPLSRKK